MRVIKRPILTLIALILVVLTIVYIESTKPSVSRAKSESGLYPSAPEFVGIAKWINSEPLKIEELKGKVVLVDFWTYTCVNCIRTLPYLNEWYEKYKDNGFVIVGVHSPEFEFEKEYDNVLNAVEKYGIKYPVAQDNDHATWDNYYNRYWPAEYLIDVNGNIRHFHAGEGDYEETEKLIQELLMERMEMMNKSESLAGISKPKEVIPVDFSKVKSPEIYLGYETSRGNFGNTEGLKPEQIQEYKLPSLTNVNKVYLEGKWKSNNDNLELVGDKGKIILEYNSKIANIVAASDKPVDINILLDGKMYKLTVSASQLYVAGEAEDYGDHKLELDVLSPGFRIYTFTFG